MLAMSCAGLAGCSSLPFEAPWTESSFGSASPAAPQSGAGGAGTAGGGLSASAPRTLILLGEIADPDHSPLPSGEVGAGLGDALSRAMRAQGPYDVWMDAAAARQIQSAMQRPGAAREKQLAGILGAQPNLGFVITGKVTDFVHTADLPANVARRGVFFNRHNEAFAAVDLQIIDVKARRIVANEHAYGSARAGAQPAEEFYRDIHFGSPPFWRTPLGKASEEAIARAMDRIRAVAPPHSGPPRIMKLVGRREVEIDAGRDRGLAQGQTFTVLRASADGRSLEPVHDEQTGQPVQVRIEVVKSATATAWLLGQPPAALDLRGLAIGAAPAGRIVVDSSP
jgi:hypothetical protein